MKKAPKISKWKRRKQDARGVAHVETDRWVWTTFISEQVNEKSRAYGEVGTDIMKLIHSISGPSQWRRWAMRVIHAKLGMNLGPDVENRFDSSELA